MVVKGEQRVALNLKKHLHKALHCQEQQEAVATEELKLQRLKIKL